MLFKNTLVDQSINACKVFFIIISTCLFVNISQAQTILEGGDIAIMGVNAQNNGCSGNSGSGEDVVTFVAFQDIVNGTLIDITDNGWERVNPFTWGDSEGTYRFERTGGTIPAGTTFNFTLRSDIGTSQAVTPGWVISDLNVPPPGITSVNMNSGGDQLYIMQNGIWDNLGATGDHNATYSGDILYGFNTRTFWSADGTSQQSNLHPSVDPCFFMNPTGGTTNYVNYTGPLTPATQIEWINRIKDPNNWSSYSSCTAYNNNPPPASIPIESSGISVDCSTCTGCGTVNDILTFNLPVSGGPFNIVYTDGSSEFPVNGISDGHTENVTVTTNTTYEIVSITDAAGCPIYSNFDGVADITVDGAATANPASATLCDDGTGQAIFDLTALDMTVNGGSGTVNWYSDAAGTIPIPIPSSHIVLAPGETVYATVGNPPCESDTAPVTLTVSGTGAMASISGGGVICSSQCSEVTLTITGGAAPYDVDAQLDFPPFVNGYDFTIQTPDLSTTLTLCVEGNFPNYDNATNTLTIPDFTGSNLTITLTGVSDNSSCGAGTVDPTPLFFDIQPTPEITTASLAVFLCDDGSGQADFDLTIFDNNIDVDGGNTVLWWTDIDGTMAISDPTNYTSPGGTVYASVSNGNCESETIPVNLNVDPGPNATPTSTSACDDGTGQAIFDLTLLDGDVDQTGTNTVVWYSDIDGTILIGDPTTYLSNGEVVYATVDNGVCESTTVGVLLTVISPPDAFSTTADACDDGTGQAVFDLTTLDETVNGSSGNSVSWFTDMAGNNPITDPTAFITSGETIYAVVNDGLCPSAPVDVTLTIVPGPTATAAFADECADGTGQAVFDLTILEATVNGGLGDPVTWYSDPGGTVMINNPSTYLTGSTIVYASTFDGTCPSAPVDVTLTVIPIPVASPASASACDDGTGQATFDLTLLDGTVDGASSGFVIWSEDPSENNLIGDPTNFTTPGTSVYATVSNGACTSTPVEIILIVNLNPTLSAVSVECQPSNTEIVISFTIETGPAPYMVTGSPDGTLTGNMFVSDPIPLNTNYDFLITDANGCTTTLSGVQLNCNCATSAGTMDPELLEACDPLTVIATHNGDELVDGSDVIMYYLHDGANTTLGTIYDVNDTGVFEYVPPMDYFTTYYISLVAGNDDGTGNVDLDDPCLSVSEGQPVIFYPPAVDITETYTGCSGDGYSFTASDGTVYDEDNPTAGNLVLQDGNGCDYILNVNLVFNPATPDINETYNGCLGDGYTYTAPDGTVYDEDNPTANNVILQDANNCDYILNVDLTFNNLPTANITSISACDEGGNQATFDLTSLENTVSGGSGTVTWYSDMGVSQIGNPDNYLSGSTSVYATVSDALCESIPVEIILTVNDNPSFIDLTDDCLPSNITYEVTFEITSGTAPYVVTGDPGTLTGNIFTSDPIAVGDAYSFMIMDANNCGPIEVSGANLQCDCASNAGLMDSDLINQCGGGIITATYLGGEILEGDDILLFILHDNPGNTAGTIYATNGTPEFDLDLITGLMPNTTYYISAVVGNDLGTGEIDLADPCLAVSQGTPFIIYPIPTADISPSGTICGGDNCFDFSILVGGSAPINLEYTIDHPIDGIQSFSIATAGPIYNLPVCANGLQDGTITLTLDNVSDTNCPGVISNDFGSVTVIPNSSSTFTGPLCIGQEIDINGTIYNELNPIGTETITGVAFNGCDSIVTVDLQFTNSVTGEELYTGCEGDGYFVLVNGNTYDETTTDGMETLMSFAGCDSIVTIDLDFLLEVTGDELYTGCMGDGYSVIVNGNTYDENIPNGTETIPSVNGCDSIVTINLVYNSIATGNEDYEGCQGDGYSVDVNGTIYNEDTATGVETLMTSSGCDSTVIINLVFNEASTGEVLHEGCIGDGFSIVVNGNTYDEGTPNGIEVIPNAIGCDSTITIDLNFGSSVNGDELYNGCIGDGYSVVVNGNTYDEATPTGIETLISGGGCDSIVNIDLTFNTALTSDETYQGCEGDGYFVVVNGITYDQTMPSGSETLSSSLGCDSIVSINLVFNAAVAGEEVYSGCNGDGYAVLVNGNVYNETTPTGTETIPSSSGCDSIVTITLEFNDALAGDETYSGCNGDGYSVEVNGNTYNETTPTGTETIPSSSGCDSIVTITLDFNGVLMGSETYSGCNGDGYSVVVNGNTYDEATSTGVETITNPGGCDSTVIISLTFNNPSTGNELYDGCFGDGYSVVVNGNTYDESTPTGTEIIPNAMGCDSTITIALNFSNSVSGDELYHGCIGDGYNVVVNGNTYDEDTPTGMETIQSTSGCDSIVTINLMFNTSLTEDVVYDGCAGDGFSVVVNGTTYDESTPTGTEILPSSIGCDSIISINLVYDAASFGNVDYSGCSGDGFAVLVNGTVYNEGNQDGFEVVLNAAGCDSTILVDLNFSAAVTGDEFYQGCENDGYTVMVGGTVYNEGNPTGTESLMSASGCDSIVSIDLSYDSSIQLSESYTGCENDGYSVTVNGNLYNEMNAIGMETMVSSSGCDSIVLINLVFNPVSTESIAYTGCNGDGYSVTVNGTTYDEGNPTGIETIVGGNYLGCDSIVNVGLAFDSEITNSIIETICDAEVMIINGTTYGFNNPSGVETIIGGSVGGCDSIINVDLNFYPQVLASLSQDAFICPGDEVPLSFILEGGTTYDVIYNNGTNNILLDSILNGHTVMVSPANTTTYSIVSVDAIGIPCDPMLPSSSVTIEVSNIGITAQVDSDFNGFSVGCNGSSDGLASATPMNGNAPYSFEWSNGASGPSTGGLSAGAFTVTVSDAIGCTAETQVILTEPTGIQASLNAESPTCFGEDDGWITIDTVLGGGGTYSFSLDGQSYQSITAYPISIPFVEAGNYDVYFQDANDCVSTVSINVSEPQEPTLVLADDVEIILGDSVELFGLTNISVDEYDWNTTIFMSCDTCYATFTTPMESINYSLTVVDSLGCTARDEINITVLKPRAVYIPNAFSPNGDGINDIFFINAGPGVTTVKKFRVFSRWGEEAFSMQNFLPNNPLIGWDGNFPSKRMNPGVFVYIAEVEFLDGHVEFYQGDVTLVRQGEIGSWKLPLSAYESRR